MLARKNSIVNILFLCTANLNRSKSAEAYFSEIDKANSYSSAGLSEKYCKRYGGKLCSLELLDWADIIYVMEVEHEARIMKYTGEQHLSKIINLAIDDIYTYMQPELINVLTKKVKPPNQIKLR